MLQQYQYTGSGRQLVDAGSASADDHGEFRVFSLTPGRYYLLVSPQGSIPNGAHVGSADIENLEIHLVPPIHVTGQISIEGSASVKVSDLSIRLSGHSRQSVNKATAKLNGAFEFANVPPDVYRVEVTPLDALYLFSVRWSNADVTTGEIDLSQDAGDGQLNIVLSANGGEVTGAVQTAEGKPVTQALVVLVPSETRAPQDWWKLTTPDRDGHFRLSGIAPGSYLFYALEDADPNAARYDPDFLKPYESQAKALLVQANGKENMTLTVIQVPQDH